MDLAIAIGQGIGLAVACGLVALLPVAIGAIGALAGILPGALGFFDSVAVAIGSVAAGGANAALSPRITGVVRLALAGVAGGVVFELAAGDELPYAGLVAGALIGVGSAWVVSRVVDPAAGKGPAGGIAAIVAIAATVAAGLALIPFAGYVLAAVAGWLGLRARRAQERKYAGLRVLR